MKAKTLLSTSPKAPQFFSKLFEELGYINAFQTYEIPSDVKGEEPKEACVFTHPIFSFVKPKRISKHGVEKPEALYYRVYESEPFGVGSYGGVCNVVGSWHQEGLEWKYKSKANSIVKTSIFANSQKDFKDSIASFECEYEHGKWAPHMGYRYPPVTYGDSTFLTMVRQPGETLETLIMQLIKDPNCISVTDKLQITISMLEALGPQLAECQTSDISKRNLGGLIHQDLKPSNIMVAADRTVKIIDYGLAVSQFETRPQALYGTPLFFAPELISCEKRVTDFSTDLASMSRCIAELWGDKSGDSLHTMRQILNRNKENRLTGLLEGVLGLSEEEKTLILKTITSMTHPDYKQRPDRLKLIAIFKDLLQNRLVYTAAQQLEDDEKLLSKMNSYLDEVHKLSATQLLEILKSKHGNEFARRCTNVARLTMCLRLGIDLLQLDDGVLKNLNARGFYFNHLELETFLEKNPDLTLNDIARLRAQGVSQTLDTMNYWLNIPVPAEKRIQWAKLCRAFYEAIPDTDKLFETIDDPFKKAFHRHFLQSREFSTTEEYNVLLINRHLLVYLQRVEFIKSTVASIYPNTEFEKEILEFLEKKEKNNAFILKADKEIDYLCDLIDRLSRSLKNIRLYGPEDARKETLRFEHISETVQQLEERSRDYLFLDNLKQTLLNMLSPEQSTQFCSELNPYYAQSHDQFARIQVALNKHVNFLKVAFEIIEEIKAHKKIDVFKDSAAFRQIKNLSLEQTQLCKAKELYKICESFQEALELIAEPLDDFLKLKESNDKRGSLFKEILNFVHVKLEKISIKEISLLGDQLNILFHADNKLYSDVAKSKASCEYVYDFMSRKTKKVDKPVECCVEIISHIDDFSLIDPFFIKALDSLEEKERSSCQEFIDEYLIGKIEDELKHKLDFRAKMKPFLPIEARIGFFAKERSEVSSSQNNTGYQLDW